MNPIFVFSAVLLTGVSGYHIRGGRAMNSMDVGANPLVETKLSFDYDAATTAAPPTPPPTRASQESALIGTTWTAVEVASMVLGEDHPITLSFDIYSIAGSTGCNRYQGGFNMLSEDSFRCAEELATTKMYCQYPGAMEQEMGFLTFMKSHAFLYEIATDVEEGKDELVLYDSATSSIKGEVLARFVQGDPDAEAEGDKTRRLA